MKNLMILYFMLILIKLDCQEAKHKFLPYFKNDKFIYCNSDKIQQIRESFEYAEPFRKGFAIVGNYNLYGVINEDGKYIVPIKYRDIQVKYSISIENTNNPCGIYFSLNDDSIFYSLLSEELSQEPNELVSEEEVSFPKNIGIFKLGNKFGFIENGDTIIKPIYDLLDRPYFLSNYLIAKKNSTSGLITTKNIVLVPFEYFEILWDSENNLFELKSNKLSENCIYICDSIYCGYVKAIKNFWNEYILVENSENLKYYIEIKAGKELRIE